MAHLWTRGEIIDRMAELRVCGSALQLELWNKTEAAVFNRLVALHREIAREERAARSAHEEYARGGVAAIFPGALFVLHTSKLRRLHERRAAVVAMFDGPTPIRGVTRSAVAQA